MNKRAQHILFAGLFAFFIFFLLFTIFFDYIIDPNSLASKHAQVAQDAARAAMTLTQKGYPQQWTIDDVQRAGLADHGLINLTKVAQLQAINQQSGGYERIKQLLGIRYDYLITIQADDLDIAIGETGIENEQALLATDPTTLSSTRRALIHPQTRRPVGLEVYLYR